MQRSLLLCLFGFLFLSCEYFNSHEERVAAIVDAEMELIHFDEVDKFPYFEECQETVSKEKDFELSQKLDDLHPYDVPQWTRLEAETTEGYKLWTE